MEKIKGTQERQFKQIEETPFTLVTDNENTRILMGNYLVTEKIFENENEAEKYIETKSWELLFNVMTIHHTKINEYIDNENKMKGGEENE